MYIATVVDPSIKSKPPIGSEEEDEGIDSYRKGGYHAVRVGDPFNGNRYIAPRKLGWSQFSMTEQQPTTKRQQFICLIVMYAVVLRLFHLWKMNEIPSSSSPTTRFNNNNSKEQSVDEEEGDSLRDVQSSGKELSRWTSSSWTSLS
ncbi:hypothetical protein ACFE04_019859 [Oxalis oulophora]